MRQGRRSRSANINVVASYIKFKKQERTRKRAKNTTVTFKHTHGYC